MTFRGLVAALFLYVLFMVYSKAHAGNEIKVKVVPPASPTDITPDVVPLLFTDNQDGTGTLVVVACGSTIYFTGSKEMFDKDEGMDVIVREVNQACKKVAPNGILRKKG